MTTEEKKPFDLAACRARAADATPGPWRVNEDEDWIEAADPKFEGFIVLDLSGEDGMPPENDPDLRFILQSREDVPELLAIIDRQAAWMVKAQKALDDWEKIASNLAGLTPDRPEVQ